MSMTSEGLMIGRRAATSPESERTWNMRRFLEAMQAEKLSRLGLHQAECLVVLRAGPMLAVRAAHRGWHAPNPCVGVLIREGYACYVPPVEAGGPPSYAITPAGEELLVQMQARPRVWRFLKKGGAV